MRIVGALVAVSIILTGCYDESSYVGDGSIRDAGLISYPRYHVELSSFPLDRPGTHAYNLKGLPSEALDLLLYVNGATGDDREIYERSATHITAQLEDDRGRVICSASGTPASKNEEQRWVLMSTSETAAYWHHGCQDVVVKTGSAYRLVISVGDVDPRIPAATARPTLHGGGNEVP